MGGAGVEPGPPPYQRGALPPELSAEWARLGSNQQPLACKTSALPLELLARTSTPGGRSPRHERPRSVEERDVPHGTRGLLGVHQHAMPAVQHDRVVLRMANG